MLDPCQALYKESFTYSYHNLGLLLLSSFHRWSDWDLEIQYHVWGHAASSWWIWIHSQALHLLRPQFYFLFWFRKCSLSFNPDLFLSSQFSSPSWGWDQREFPSSLKAKALCQWRGWQILSGTGAPKTVALRNNWMLIRELMRGSSSRDWVNGNLLHPTVFEARTPGHNTDLHQGLYWWPRKSNRL